MTSHRLIEPVISTKAGLDHRNVGTDHTNVLPPAFTSCPRDAVEARQSSDYRCTLRSHITKLSMKTADEILKCMHGVRIAHRDFQHAADCVRVLLKREWFKPILGRRSDAAVQQYALVTALVITYARPFTSNYGFGKFDENAADFSAEERNEHTRLMNLRNKIYAHSEHTQYEWEPWVTPHFTTAIETAPDFSISEARLLNIEPMIKKLIEAARTIMAQP